MTTFKYSGSSFYFNDQPIRLLSGAIHYFRTVPEHWQDRLAKLKACGLNTVETYIPWNLHEPKKGQFHFEGMADIVRFIELAGEIGLHVIVRPAPYICAEWEFGGLPSWLLADSDIRLRCYHQPFLDHVDAYYDVLLPKLKPLLCTNGGPIIAMQVENEYGSYSNDKRYLIHQKESMIARGMDVLLFTSDGPEDAMLQGGMIDGVLATVNFGSRAAEAFEKLKEYQPDAPFMCMEYWNGWFDHWHEEHHTRPAEDVASVLDEMLSLNASVNFYMFHGGTNFGFFNGANGHTVDSYEPTVTSYDYDALLTESGEPTAKYYAVRDVISKYVDLGECELPAPIAKKAYGRMEMTEQASLTANLDNISTPIYTAYPETMEKLGQDYGFIHYETFISGPRPKEEFFIQDLHDRAQVFLNGKLAGILDRTDANAKLEFDVPAEGLQVTVLVENLGRVNYGPYMKDRKGITEGARYGRQFLSDWKTYTLPLTDLSGLQFGALSEQMDPSFFRGTLVVDEPCDTFIGLEGWTKGFVFINGFNLGRYWNTGPQKRLYVPGPLLQQGNNEIVIFELHGTADRTVTFLDQPDLGEESSPGKMTYLCQEIPKEWHTGVQDAVPWHLFEPFELVDTVTGMQALEQTVVRACWSPNGLFIQFICEDRHIASDFLNRDDPLYEQDVVEMFFDEYGNGTHYLELEVSPRNVVFDARIENDGFGKTVRIDKEWDFVGLQTNVYLDALDRLVYEIQIPACNFDRPFRAGMQWRVNFYRIDENPEGLREYQAWQPTGSVNFHVSDEFGTIQFI